MLVLGFTRVWAQSTSLTEEECEASGKQIARLLDTKNTKAVMDMFDVTTNFDLVAERLDLDERNKVFMRERHRAATVRALNTSLHQYDSARFLRILWIDGEKLVLIRLQSKKTGDYNYLGCILARDDFSGGIKITDLHDFLAGGTLSQLTRNIIKGIMDAQTQALKKRSGELLESHLNNLELIETASNLVETRQFKEALDTLKGLPETWKRQRLVLNLRLLASQHVDHDECQRAAQDWAETFPGDPSLDMIFISIDEWLGKYEQAIRHVDSLMETVGKDGCLSLRKAGLCLKNNDPGSARRSAREALELEPDLDEARLIIVKAALREKDHRTTLFAWKDFSLRFPWTDLAHLTEGEPGYNDFIQSAEYLEWAAKKQAL